MKPGTQKPLDCQDSRYLLMENNVNHPNVYGHTLFADSLMALFPKSE